MKQKRKVKSLITQKKDWGESVLTTLLLILGVILCLGSASLMTMSVGAASTSNGFDYKSTVDDKTEVLYKLQFSKSGSLSTVVSEMFTDKNDDFYISGGLIVNGKNGNKIGNVKSNILGGSDNEVYSNNITIIGGNENKVAESNDNAIILGGDGNTMTGVSSGNPSIMVGGSSNIISKGHDNDGIIGGSNNTIGENVSNSFIIGGTDNEVNASNVIVGGSNVKVNTGNVFVFSTINNVFGLKFEPQTPNAFYINVKNGLGINTQSVGQGITVNGPVRFGEININTPCNGDNIGVIGSWNGCLVGCTKDGQSNGKWTLFDLGDSCQDSCESNNHCFNEVSKIKTGASYNSFCTDGVNTGHAKACTPDVLNQIQNVVFETTLIDSTVACPSNPANKCIYKCNSGYHLTGDRTYGIPVEKGGSYACYSECIYQWADVTEPQVFQHNETVIGYDDDEVECSKDNPSDPLPEHCGNHNHKKTLVCSNGTMYIANSDGSATSTEAGSYKYKNCKTNKYNCNTSIGEYDLNKTDITKNFTNGGLSDTVDQRTKKDRSLIDGTRGQYRLCLDYKTGANYTTIPGNEASGCVVVQTQDPYEAHYKFEGCQNGYTRSTRPGETDKYICRQSCSLSIRDIYNRSKTTSVKDDSTITLYDAISAECKKGQHCNSKKYYCDDGILKNDDNHNQNATDRDKYNYENCETIGNNCEGYDVDSYIYENYKDVSIYLGPCQKYQPYQNSQERWGWITSCNYEGSWYMLTGCVPGYHAVESTGWNCEINPGKYCIEDKITEECDVHHTKPENSEWMDGSKVYIRNLVSKTQGKERWKCANDEAGVNCQWYCIGGYVMNAAQTGCEYNPGPTLKDPVCLDQHFGCNPGKQIETGEILGENIYGEANIGVGWKWKCENDGTISNLCIECNPFYHENLAGTGCEHYKCLGDINGFQNAERVNNYSRPENGDAPLHFEDRPDYDPTNACKIKCKDGYYKVEENGFISCELIPNDSLLVRFDLKGGNFENPGQENPMIVDMGTEITIPSAIKGCDEFKGWQIDGRGNHYKPGDKYIVNLSTTFVADWNNKECPESLCIGGDEPAPKTANDHIERGGTPPTNGGSVPWVYNDETGDLNPCEWRCKSGYIRKGNKCVEKECGTGKPTSDGVITGASTYTGVDDNRKWTYNSGSLLACQWKCLNGREVNQAQTGCIRTVNASCGDNPRHYICDGGTSGSQKTIPGNNNEDAGWTWTCVGTPGGTSGNCIECNTASGYTLQDNTCKKNICPAPIITSISGTLIYFDSNGGDYTSLSVGFSETNESNWEVKIGSGIGRSTSPRDFKQIKPSYNHGYLKIRPQCSNGTTGDSSNAMEFDFTQSQTNYPEMIIDKIEECKVYYHFIPYDPISGKSCCNPVRLDYSYDGVTFSPLTTTYKNGMSFASHGKEGKVYFRYSLDGGKSWSSTTSYNMSKQSCGSSSCSRTFYDGTQLDWVANGLYAEDGYKLAEISYWSAATSNTGYYNEPCRPINNNSNCTYNTNRRTLDAVTTYDCPDRTFYLSVNDSNTLYNAYINHYHNTPTDKTIIYVPGSDNNWCKLEMRIASDSSWGRGAFNFYVDGGASHVGIMCR